MLTTNSVSRALAGRLLKVLQHVIHPDQTCGVKGRFIGENVAFLRDVIEFSKEHDVPIAILSLDQEKAFDRVNWDFLLAVLSRMGFGPSFISWVRLLYSGIRSSILINGYTSEAFFPSRGVRQGCPLSPLLYVISMEVLAVAIRSNPAIVWSPAAPVVFHPCLLCLFTLMIRRLFRPLM